MSSVVLQKVFSANWKHWLLFSSSTTFLAHLFGKIGSFLLFCSSRACSATEGSKTARKINFAKQMCEESCWRTTQILQITLLAMLLTMCGYEFRPLLDFGEIRTMVLKFCKMWVNGSYVLNSLLYLLNLGLELTTQSCWGKWFDGIAVYGPDLNEYLKYSELSINALCTLMILFFSCF